MSLDDRHVVLIYEYVPNMLERRAPYRAGHLALLKRWQADGRLHAAGAFDPPTGALLILRADADADALRAEDPYVRAGLVSASRVEPWTVTIQ